MLPLDDLLVLDLSRVLSGPFCSMHLADFGARVVKLERPGAGDDTRHFGPPFAGGGESTYFLSVNRNKESLAVDMKRPEGKDIAHRLAARADVLLENFRPGALDRLGLDYETLRKENPRLIYVSISGFGHAGLPEWSARPGYDIVVQGMGGGASLNGEPDGPPYKSGVAIADLVSGLYAFIGTLLALHARARTGRGQHVDVSMLDGQIALLTYHATAHLIADQNPTRVGNRHTSIVPYETFRTADKYINIACGNDSLYRAFATEVLFRPDLTTDERFRTNRARVTHREALLEIINPLLAAQTSDYWLTRLERAGVPCGPIYTVAEALSHPQVIAREMVVPLDHPTAGPIRVPGVPVRLSDTPGAIRTPPPLLGEHTHTLLRDLLSLDDATLTHLTHSGIISPRIPAE